MPNIRFKVKKKAVKEAKFTSPEGDSSMKGSGMSDVTELDLTLKKTNLIVA